MYVVHITVAAFYPINVDIPVCSCFICAEHLGTPVTLNQDVSLSPPYLSSCISTRVLPAI